MSVVLGSLLFTAQLPIADPTRLVAPEPIVASLIAAGRPIGRRHACVPEDGPPEGWAPVSDLLGRIEAARRQVEAIWDQPSALQLDIRAQPERAPACDAASAAADVAEAEAALLAHADLLTATLRAPSWRGAWIGPLRLCRDTVARVKFGRDWNGQPALLVDFRPAAVADFARLTRDNVGRSLAIRLDDTIVSTPTINEPILGGSAQITGDQSAFTALSAAIMAPC